MDFRWLDDVLTLLDECNLSRAAARRNVTQPAFSRRIKSFEHWVGVTLLERKANRIELAPSLIANEDEIKSLVMRVNELKQKIRNFKSEQAHVTITTQHSLMFSIFPDLAEITQSKFANLTYRLRAANRAECVSMFLRGDVNMLLCYEHSLFTPLLFDSSVQKYLWGKDRLIPVVGGKLRFKLSADLRADEDMPIIVYPEHSYFGEILTQERCNFATKSTTINPFCQTAYSVGIKEMVLNGLGVSWLPFSMVHRELGSGEIINLSEAYGSVELKIWLYANSENAASIKALDFFKTNDFVE